MKQISFIRTGLAVAVLSTGLTAHYIPGHESERILSQNVAKAAELDPSKVTVTSVSIVSTDSSDKNANPNALEPSELTKVTYNLAISDDAKSGDTFKIESARRVKDVTSGKETYDIIYDDKSGVAQDVIMKTADNKEVVIGTYQKNVITLNDNADKYSGITASVSISNTQQILASQKGGVYDVNVVTLINGEVRKETTIVYDTKSMQNYSNDTAGVFAALAAGPNGDGLYDGQQTVAYPGQIRNKGDHYTLNVTLPEGAVFKDDAMPRINMAGYPEELVDTPGVYTTANFPNTSDYAEISNVKVDGGNIRFDVDVLRTIPDSAFFRIGFMDTLIPQELLNLQEGKGYTKPVKSQLIDKSGQVVADAQGYALSFPSGIADANGNLIIFKVGDQAFEDANKDGKFNTGETGVAGVEVKIYDTANKLVHSTVTDAGGKYTAYGIAKGDYVVKFTPPTGYVAADSSKLTQNITLSADNMDVDLPLLKAAPPTTETPVDPITPPSTEAPSTEAPSTEAPSTEAPSTEAPSTEAPSTEAPSTEAPSTEAPSTEAPSTEAPSTEAPSTEAPVKTFKIGDTVWNDMNKDGKVDEGEAPIAGVNVHLVNKDGNTIATTKTDEKGQYAFPDQPSGDYTVTFDMPAGYSAVNPDRLTQKVTLADGDNLDADLGLLLLPVKPAVPTTLDKSVLYNGTESDSAIIEAGASYAYSLNAHIGDNVKDTIVISDDLADGLDAKSARVVDKDGKDITADGELKIDEDKDIVTWTTKKAADYKGQDIRVEITTEVKDGIDLSQYEVDGSVLIPNTGEITVDGGTPIKSDTVNVTPLEDPSETTVLKSASSDTVEVGADYNYQVKGQITDKRDTASIVVTDDLVDELELVDAKVLDAEGNDITADGTLELDKDKELVTWTPKDVKAFVGKLVVLDIKAHVKDNADLSKYKKDDLFVIPNTAKFTVDGKDTESNKVDVSVPVVAANADKKVIDSGKLVDVKDALKGDNVQYALNYTIPNGVAVTDLKLTDDLEDTTDLTGAKVYLVQAAEEETAFVDEEAPDTFSTEGLKDITDQGELKLDKEKEVFSWTPDKDTHLAGKQILVVVEGQVKKDADLKAYKEGIIPNISELSLKSGDKETTVKSEPANLKVTEPKAEEPTTEEPTTEEPTTEDVTTEDVTTEAPSTEAPSTEAPTTEAVTTEAVTTEAPVQKPAPQPIAKVLPNTGSAAGNIALYGGILGLIGAGIYLAVRRRQA